VERSVSSGFHHPARENARYKTFPAYRLETQLRPAYSKSAFDQVRDVSWLGLYFSGIETNSEGLMRFVMNPTLRQRYPDDDEFGKKLLEEGRRIE